jgi:hypothetical protein
MRNLEKGKKRFHSSHLVMTWIPLASIHLMQKREFVAAVVMEPFLCVVVDDDNKGCEL